MIIRFNDLFHKISILVLLTQTQNGMELLLHDSLHKTMDRHCFRRREVDYSSPTFLNGIKAYHFLTSCLMLWIAQTNQWQMCLPTQTLVR